MTQRISQLELRERGDKVINDAVFKQVQKDLKHLEDFLWGRIQESTNEALDVLKHAQKLINNSIEE